MASLRESLRNSVSTEILDVLDDIVGAWNVSGTETKTSGACSPGVKVTYLSVTGTVAFTLADGSYEGQQKVFRCTVAASTPAGTLTPANLAGGATLAFNAVDDMALLEWRNGEWHVLAYNSVTFA